MCVCTLSEDQSEKRYGIDKIISTMGVCIPAL